MHWRSLRSLCSLWFILLLFLLATPAALAQLEPLYFDQGLVGLGLALRTLPVSGTVLYVTAHPDDENDAVLFRLRKGMGMRTALLTVTRGEGGQNEIGPELFEALGILRTEELLAVQRYCGAQQFFTRAFEFGFSYSVEETFDKWGKQVTLGDIVHIIRRFRPIVILTLPPAGAGGGQHHQASAILAAEAFRAAADPKQFPEQITAGLTPWQPKKIYRTQFFEGSRETANAVNLSLGEMDPLLGESYAQLGARARSNHRCQGMNVLPDAGEHTSSYILTDAVPEAKPAAGSVEKSLFDGLDTSLVGLMQYAAAEEAKVPFLRAALLSLQTTIDLASQSFKRGSLEEVADYVFQGLRNVEDLAQEVRAGQLSKEAKDNLLPFLENKVNDFTQAANAASFVQLETFQVRDPQDRRRVDPEEPIPQIDGMVTRGESFYLGIRFLNRGGRSVNLKEIVVMPSGSRQDWQTENVSGTLGKVEPQKSLQLVYRIKVPPSASYTQPYWFRKSKTDFRYEVTDASLEGVPFAPPPLAVRAAYHPEGSSVGRTAKIETSAQYRWFDVESAKERRMAVKVVPELSISVKPSLLLAPIGRGATERTLQVSVHNNVPGAATATLSLKLPPGWTSAPASATVGFSRENEESTTRFVIHIPPRVPAGDYSIRAEVRLGNEVFDSGYQTIAYHHIQTRHLFHPAETVARAFDVSLPAGLNVGYIMGVGDEVPEALEQLGATVRMLGPQDLAYGDLNGHDVIVTGVRAYKDRTDLLANNARLLDYVKSGGHLVVQYNKYEFGRAQYGPYPATINRPHDRVTDEDSAVRILAPDHPIFRYPNRIADEDWKGWVQERGLYFLGKWDPAYQPLVELQDPFPNNNQPKEGALLVASYGNGTYIYTGLGFFRQLPEGVPGAYRLFANIVSLKRAPKE